MFYLASSSCLKTWVKSREGRKILENGTTFRLRYIPTFYSEKLANFRRIFFLVVFLH